MTETKFGHCGLKDLKDLEGIYRNRLQDHGTSPVTLGWTKGKQNIRFDVLLDRLPCENRSFLDVGCGFGDLNTALRVRCGTYRYLGVDMMAEFVAEGKRKYGNDEVAFQVGSFLSDTFDRTFDYVIGCGIFAYQLNEIDNYDYIAQILAKMWSLCTEAVAVDFLSDRVTFRRDRTFYANPGRVLDMAFSLTRNVRLQHDYMPFEFSLTLFKDDSFDNSDTVFRRCRDAR
jgi:SAM-dependent methyltransferase